MGISLHLKPGFLCSKTKNIFSKTLLKHLFKQREFKSFFTSNNSDQGNPPPDKHSVDKRSTNYTIDEFSSTQTSYNGCKDIFSGKYNDPETCYVVPDGYTSYKDTFAGDCLISIKDSLSVDSYFKTIESGSVDITQIDSSDVLWKHSDITRRYSIPNLLTTATFDQDFAGDEFKTFREWFHEDGTNRDNYSYAYAIYDDSWNRVRENVEYYGMAATKVGVEDLGCTYRKITTLCHEITSNLTVGMEVLEKGKRVSITTFDDPSTVRYVSAIGLPAPTLLEFISHDISSWFAANPWIWAVLVAVALILLIALIFIFPPLLKALMAVFKLLVVVLYFPIWIVKAAMAMSQHRKAPPLWFWGVKRYVINYNSSAYRRRKRG